jgi:hypothetical protein
MEWTSFEIFVAGFIILIITLAIFAAVLSSHSEIGKGVENGIDETLQGFREALLTMKVKLETPVDIPVSG